MKTLTPILMILILVYLTFGYINRLFLSWGFVDLKKIPTVFSRTISLDPKQMPTTGKIVGGFSDPNQLAVYNNQNSNGYFLFGPYIPLFEGEYELVVEYASALNAGPEIGQVNLAARKGGMVAETIGLENTHKNWVRLNKKIQIEKSASDWEVRFLAYPQNEIWVKSITLKRIQYYETKTIKNLPRQLGRTGKYFLSINAY